VSLKELRKEHGLSASQMASILHISRPTLVRIEHDPLRLTDYFLADHIASIFGLPLEVVFPQFKERHSPDSSS
jgi:DNA-binding XRE family transcriptional regulator